MTDHQKRGPLSRALSIFLLGLGLVGLTVTGLTSPDFASAAPSQEDVARAREAEQQSARSVAQIEVALAEAATAAQNAQIDAALAVDELNAAKERLEQAIATAKTASVEASEAEVRYEEGLKELASIAQVTYRSGGGALDAMAPYLQSDGLRSVEQRRSAVSSFGSAADTKMQEVAALRQVADILHDAAEQAKKTEQEAFSAVELRTQEAEQRAEVAAQVLADTQAAQAALIEELAVRRNTTVALESARLAEAQRVRDQEAADQASKPNGGGNSGGNNSGGSNSGGNNSGGSNPGGGNTDPGTPSPPITPPPVEPPPVKPPPVKPPPSSSSVDTVVSYARSKLGAPYLWGGNGPSYDCSGITYMAYKQVGITLPRSAAGQYSAGSRVPISDARAGDLVFWARNGSIYHVALHSGNGNIISAHQPGTPMDEGPIYNWSLVLPYVVRVL